ncbi:MAG: hypothetical protein K940chlam2_00915 [Chlamydiae bacterium]|nr:hypothetical protein [Chlamydiota bacterium]
MTDEEGIRGLAHLPKTCRAFRAVIRTDKVFIEGLVERNWQALILANLTLKEDQELIGCAMRGARSHASYRDIRDLFEVKYFAQDKEVVLGAVREDLTCFRYVNERFQDDLEVMSVAVSKYGLYLEDASERLRDNDDVFALQWQRMVVLWDMPVKG